MSVVTFLFTDIEGSTTQSIAGLALACCMQSRAEPTNSGSRLLYAPRRGCVTLV